MLGPTKFLDSTKFWIQKIVGPNNVGYKNIWDKICCIHKNVRSTFFSGPSKILGQKMLSQKQKIGVQQICGSYKILGLESFVDKKWSLLSLVFLPERQAIYFPIVKKYTIDCPTTEHMQFLMDCTILPDVILLHQKHGKVVHDSLLYLTRTLCYSIYKSRNKLLGKWNRWMILCLRTSEDDK